MEAPDTTISRDLNQLEQMTGNIYQSLVIMAIRSNQISVEVKEELNRKLEDFATYADNLEEVFENREQIEISKHYESMPKPVNIAITEFIDKKVYWRINKKNKKLSSKKY